MFSVAKSVASNGRVFWAWLFLIVGAVSFMGFFYAAVISKLQPPSHNVLLLLSALGTSDPCGCGVFPLAKHEVVQARLICRFTQQRPWFSRGIEHSQSRHKLHAKGVQ